MHSYGKTHRSHTYPSGDCAGNVFQAIEDVVDVSTVDTASSVFAYLERILPELQQHPNDYFSRQEMLRPSVTKLGLLRLCNLVRARACVRVCVCLWPCAFACISSGAFEKLRWGLVLNPFLSKAWHVFWTYHIS